MLFHPKEIDYLTDRIQNGGTKVVEAKAGAGFATLSMAYAAVKFADACLRGLRGEAGVVECAYVASHVTELPFFASKLRLGCSGAGEGYTLGPLNECERIGLEKAKKELAASIEKGISFVRKCVGENENDMVFHGGHTISYSSRHPLLHGSLK